MVYVFDSSAFIECQARAYPRENFPGVWQRLEQLAVSGRLIAPYAVFLELQDTSMELNTWVKQFEDKIFLSSEKLNKLGAEIAMSCNLYNAGAQNGADPYVVALAKMRGGIAVTMEQYDINAKIPPRGAGKKQRLKVKIPTICTRFEVKHAKVLDVILSEKWRFVATDEDVSYLTPSEAGEKKAYVRVLKKVDPNFHTKGKTLDQIRSAVFRGLADFGEAYPDAMEEDDDLPL